MTQNNRREFLKVAGGAGLVGATGLAGCLGGLSGGGGGGGEDTTNIGVVYALGGLGDKSFNDMAHKGIQAAKEEMNISFEGTEPEGPDDFKTLQRKFAQDSDPNYELVTCVGYAQASALKENASSFPDQKFTIIDDSSVEGDNVSSIVFKEHQGSFQVGYMAGLLSAMDFSEGAGETNGDKVVGFVGGQQSALIKKFEAGYKAGVLHADDSYEVRSAYAGTWSDPAKGKEIAISMYDEGADVVYHAAGGTGTGVFKAAAERGRYAIGVDSDQSRSAPEYADVIVASMVKHVDTAVQNTVRNVVNGEFKGGQTTSLGLNKEGVEAVVGRNFKDKIPSDVTSKLEESRKAIVNGDISVPQKPSDVN